MLALRFHAGPDAPVDVFLVPLSSSGPKEGMYVCSSVRDRYGPHIRSRTTGRMDARRLWPRCSKR